MAFITGSRAYGTPTPDSDIDLVLRMTEEEYQLLKPFADQIYFDTDPEYGRKCQNHVLRFGKLQLLICTTDAQYRIWFEGTKTLKWLSRNRKAPVLRSEACKLFADLRTAAIKRGEE